jgi:hypothetical protein
MLKASGCVSPEHHQKFRMAALSRLSHSSGSFSTYISALKRDGLLEMGGPEFRIKKPVWTKRARSNRSLKTLWFSSSYGATSWAMKVAPPESFVYWVVATHKMCPRKI